MQPLVAEAVGQRRRNRPRALRAKPWNRPCVPSNTVRGPRKPLLPDARRVQADAAPPSPACRRLVQAPSARYSMMPPAMLPAMPERIHRLPAVEPQRSPRRRASTPSRPARWSDGSRPCGSPWASPGDSRHIASTPAAMPEQRRAAVAAEALAGGEHRRHDHRAAVHRPALEGVVEILAVRGGAVDQRGVLGAEAAGVPDRRAGPAGVDAARRAPACSRCCAPRRTARRRRSAGLRSAPGPRGGIALRRSSAQRRARRAARRPTAARGARLASARVQRTILTPASFRIPRMLVA